MSAEAGKHSTRNVVIAGLFSIVVAIIGAGANIMAANRNVQLDAKATDIALITPAPLPTYTIPPTYTPYPTQTPYPTLPAPEKVMAMATVLTVVTATPSPTEAPTSTPEMTAASSVLEIGDTWRENNRQLTLDNVEFDPMIPSIRLYFKIKNLSSGPISFSYDSTNFNMKANTGDRFRCRNDRCGDALVIEAGDSRNLGTAWVGSSLEFVGDYFKAEVTEVIITVNNLSGITKAQWRIPINH